MCQVCRCQVSRCQVDQVEARTWATCLSLSTRAPGCSPTSSTVILKGGGRPASLSPPTRGHLSPPTRGDLSPPTILLF